MHSRAILFTVGALALAGCGSSDDDTATSAPTRTVDDATVEQGITDDLSTSSEKVTDVKCPSDVAVQQGDTFTCTVTFSNGATGKAKVTQQGGNRYSYSLEAGSVQIPGSEVETSLEKDLAAQGAPNATVTCPQTIIVKDFAALEELRKGKNEFIVLDDTFKMKAREAARKWAAEAAAKAKAEGNPWPERVANSMFAFQDRWQRNSSYMVVDHKDQ